MSRFPWLAPTRTSDGNPSTNTTPVDVHSDQQFWAMPRRIRLLREDGNAERCDVCGEFNDHGFRHFKTRNYGVNYLGFEHPLSPHYIKDGERLPVHPQPGGIGYRHWLGMVVSGDESIPARVVQQYRRRLREDGVLWAFGYDMKSNKARCWYDARMPIIALPVAYEAAFKDVVSRLVRGADKVAEELKKKFKLALFGEGSVRGNLSFIQTDFWNETESVFYKYLHQLRDSLPTDPAAHAVLEGWLKTLRSAAFYIFDRYTQTGDFDAVEPRRIALARNNLGKALGGSTIREKILGLPKPVKRRFT